MNGRCRRSCCWTPFGHSTVRDGQTGSRACRCHGKPLRVALGLPVGDDVEQVESESSYS